MRGKEPESEPFRPRDTEDLTWRTVFKVFLDTLIDLQRFPFSFYRDKWFGRFDKITRAFIFYGVYLSLLLGLIVIFVLVNRLQVSGAAAVGAGILTCFMGLLLIKWLVRRHYP